MDRLWSPWRFSYVTAPATTEAKDCFLCAKATDNRDTENFVVHRGKSSFALLNTFPYAVGHLLIAPYAHVATLAEGSEEDALDIMRLTRAAEACMRTVYGAPGANIGMNIGSCAGAGVAGHIHMHVLPRWPGDVNFMTAVGETRVLPEDLRLSFEKLSSALAKLRST